MLCLRLLLVFALSFGFCACDDFGDALAGSLFQAVIHGDTIAIASLLELGAPVGAQDNEALMIACTAGNVDVVKLLVRHNADVSARGHECLVRAASTPSLDLVRYLIESVRSPIDAKNYEPLIAAAASDRHDIVQYLLDNGIDPNIRHGLPLLVAEKSHSMRAADTLLRAGARGTEELLLMAVRKSDVGLVASALQRGVSPNGIIMDLAFQAGGVIWSAIVDNVAPTDVWGDEDFLDNMKRPDHAVLIGILKHDRVSTGGVIRALESAVAKRDLDLFRALLTNIRKEVRLQVACQVQRSANDKVLEGMDIEGFCEVFHDNLITPISDPDDASEMIQEIKAGLKLTRADRCKAVILHVAEMRKFRQGMNACAGGDRNEASPARNPDPNSDGNAGESGADDDVDQSDNADVDESTDVDGDQSIDAAGDETATHTPSTVPPLPRLSPQQLEEMRNSYGSAIVTPMMSRDRGSDAQSLPSSQPNKRQRRLRDAVIV
ncbi:Ankyrin repeat domain-containing protein [Plasmodiophora brassicae]|uniref:Uncharacterized protein n=1 Tax=Plasmodiophora brassicae TaxID=37360 RepID=A0A0G4IHF7_PLABS|nr:hypothetical protein PBRA_000418 [Plasmodiophora brassicae]SPQ93105.1 unnamed protein product [Plasmodiophora brassicae]